MAKTKEKKNLHSVRFTALMEKVEEGKEFAFAEAVTMMKELATAKFDESIDLAVRLGIDPRKGDQNVRGTTNIPHGTGKKKKIAVLAKGDLAKEAEEAGADKVGDDDLIKEIQGGWKDFDVMIAAADMAPSIGKIGRFLGPKTPNKRNGTVTNAIGETVKEIKLATRIEYRIDKAAVVHLSIGKVSYTEDQIRENFIAAMEAIIKARPASAKGRYLQSVTISSTMGPGLRIDSADAEAVVKNK